MTISPEYRQRLVVMVKEPRPGRVKTRLGRDIGMVDAAWWYRHQCRQLIRRLSDPRWQIVLAVSPDISGVVSQTWPADVPRHPQGAGNVGDRMANVFRSMPKGPVVIVGSDIPAIRKPHINRAFRKLGHHEAVFGPATDGGFWLVGLKRIKSTPPAILSKVRWSGKHAMADSIASIPHLRIAMVDTLTDVDTVDDL